MDGERPWVGIFGWFCEFKTPEVLNGSAERVRGDITRSACGVVKIKTFLIDQIDWNR